MKQGFTMDRHMKTLYRVCSCTLLAFAFTTLAQAATYKWVDKDGTVHYSQQPPSDANYEKLNSRSQTPNYNTEPTAPATPAAPAGAAGNNQPGSAVIKQEVAKGEQMRKDNCEKAKKALETYTAYRRVLDKDGNVIILDDNERAKRIEDSKAAIKEFCE
jgi:hypothetical protein